MLDRRLPFVSVIMPVRNEADFITRSLGAVLNQDYPHDRMEVLLVDGLSTDGTLARAASLIAAHPDVAIAVLCNRRQIVPTGLNLATRLARGEILVRVDGHCRIEPDYISRCVAHLLTDGVDGVGGAVNTLASTPAGRAIAAAMSAPFGVGGAAFRTMQGRTLLVDTIPFPAYTRRAIALAGPYDEELVRNQDDEYNYRLRKLGCRLLLAADVKASYISRSSLRHLWRQYFEYGYYKVRVLQKHPRQMRPRQFVPPVFVLSLLISSLLVLAGSPWCWLLPGLVAVYLTANLAASVWTARRAGRDTLWALPLAFATLHLAYGLGFLVGLVRYAHRWRPSPRTRREQT